MGREKGRQQNWEAASKNGRRKRGSQARRPQGTGQWAGRKAGRLEGRRTERQKSKKAKMGEGRTEGGEWWAGKRED